MREKFDVPNVFEISFSEDRKVLRRCKVVWRDDLDLGIRFMDERRERKDRR